MSEMTQEDTTQVDNQGSSADAYTDHNDQRYCADQNAKTDTNVQQQQDCISTTKPAAMNKYYRKVDDDELRRLTQDEAMQLPDKNIAISGMAGRFPKSDSMNEFEDNLRRGVDMVQDNDNTRFACGLWGLPPRAGRLKDLSRFDYEFFGFTLEEANYVDFQMRILYEVVYESIMDAGVNPADIRGTNTGVFFGLHCNEFENALADDPAFKSNGYYAQFGVKVAQYFDFRGLTITFDAACASGFVGLHNAVHAMEEGIIDQAIVCSSNIPVHPTGSFIFFQMQMLSPTGYSRFLDSKADGYVKSEACVSMFLQKKSVAYRNYASIMATSTSVDGFKPEGITFPSYFSQGSLMSYTKQLAGVSRNHIEYLEAHGTGTPAGDPQEATAISSVYIPPVEDGEHEGEDKVREKTERSELINQLLEQNKEERLIGPLLVGSVKTNMGHSEAASGLCAVAKVVLMFEHEIIYRNLHFDHPNPNIDALTDGRLKLVVENMPLHAKIIPLSCYGFGGANVHAILRASHMPTIESGITDTVKHQQQVSPRLVVMFGRGERALNDFFDQMLETDKFHTRHCLSEDFLALLDKLSSNNIDLFMTWRGYMLVDSNRAIDQRSGEQTSSIQLARKLARIELIPAKEVNEDITRIDDPGRRVHLQDCIQRDCAIVFPGMGCEWVGMAAGLSEFKPFWSTIERLSQLIGDRIDLINCITNTDETVLSSMCSKFVSIIAYQIALINMIQKQLRVRHVRAYIGHSLGEIACAYAAGLLTEKETIMIAYKLGRVLDDNQKDIAGKMVAVWMSEEQVSKLFEEKLTGFNVNKSTIRISCINGPNSVTLSGKPNDMDWFCNELRRLSIDFHVVSERFALHNQLIMNQSIRNKMKQAVQEISQLAANYDRTKTGWITTSVQNPETRQANAEYFASNFCCKVDLLGALMKLPSNSIVIETGPSGIFGSQIKQIQEDVGRELSKSGTPQKHSKTGTNQPKQFTERQNRFHYAKLMDRFPRNSTTTDSAVKLMSCIGDLYLAGAIFDLQNFYNGPLAEKQTTGRNQLCHVRRKTPSLSSMLRWNHDQRLFVPLYPQHFSKSSAKCEVPVDIVQDRDKHLVGHCIEGRILYPATGYLLLIWRVFSFTRRKIYDACFHDVEQALLPVEFRDIRLFRAVILGNREAQLYIHYEEATGRFEIKEGGSVVVEGYAVSPVEKPDGLLHEDVRERIKGEDLKLALSSDDVYKQFRVSGYDYGESFRCIESCSYDGRYSRVKFNGSFVALTDSILQSIFLAIAEYAPSGGLFLPTRFDYVRMQPEVILKKLHDASMSFDLADGLLNTKEKRKVKAEMMAKAAGYVDKTLQQDDADDENEDDEKEDPPPKLDCIFETYCDPITGVIITDGIEMRGIKATPAPRRQDNNDVLLESYQFTRDFEEPVEDERMTRYAKEIEPYSRVCDTMSVSILGRMIHLNETIANKSTIYPLKKHLLDQEKVNAYKKNFLACRAEEIKQYGQEQVKEHEDKEEQHSGNDKSKQTPAEKNSSAYDIKQNGGRALLSVLDLISCTKSEDLTLEYVRKLVDDNSQYLVQDLLLRSFSSERFVRPIIETVMENRCTKKQKLRLIEINQGDGVLSNDLVKLITTIEPSMQLDYNLAHPDMQRLSESKILIPSKQIVKTHNLKNLTQLFNDKQLKTMDLIIYKDESCYKLPHCFASSTQPELLISDLYEVTQEGRFILMVMRSKLTLAECILLLLNELGHDNKDLDEVIAKGEINLWNRLQQINEQLLRRQENIVKEAVESKKMVCLARKSDAIGCSLILFKRIQNVVHNQIEPMLLRITHEDEQSIDGWLNQLKENFNLGTKDEQDEQDSDDTKKPTKQPRKVWLCAAATKHKPINGLIGMMQALRKELGSEHLRCYFDLFTFKATNEPVTIEQIAQCDRFKESVLRDQIWNCIDSEGNLGAYRHLTAINFLSYEDCLCKNVGRTTEQVITTESMSNSSIKGAYVNNATRGDLSSFTWFEAPMAYLSDEQRQQVVRVAYSALNFRDIMLATGRLPLDAIPIRLAMSDCLLGLEFSGIDAKGRRTMGMVFGRGIATHVMCPPESSLKLDIPDWLSLTDAATIPVVYATAIMAIVYRGRACRGESILIHAGSGGVGQAAIRLAAHLGMEIYTTVGSKEKRQFLLDEFGYCLRDDCIFNSRDTSFELAIMRATKGRGVDLVLNSLADDKLQASVRCLADGGRFLEIGKYDMSVDARMELLQLDINKTFHGILLDKLFDEDDVGPAFQNQLKLVLETMRCGLDERNGFIKPIKYTMFERHQIEEAFRFMATGKHMGKVLIEIEPELEKKVKSGGSITSGINKLPAPVPRFQLSPHKSYIITGGLGGFGLELVKWLVGVAGARRLVLTTRSGLRNGYQRANLRRLEALNGAKFLIVDQKTADTTELEGVRRLCQLALDHSMHTGDGSEKMGGIFHLAMVLKDSLLENMSAKDFDIVCRPKVNTCVYLDKVTREWNLQVDYFVAFSSVTSGKGNAGQANYAYANSCLERVCEQRRSDQMHGLAIQWGAIGDVGVAFENLGGNDIIIGGTIPQRMPSCFATLSKLLCSPFSTVLSVLPVNRGSDGTGESRDLVGAIMHVLGIKDASKVSDEATLGDLGLDSLMAVEIRQYIEREYDMTLNIQEIRALTIAKIREIGESEKPAKAAASAKDEMARQGPAEVQSYGSKLEDKKTDGGISKAAQSINDTIFNKDSITSFVPRLRLPHKPWCRLNNHQVPENESNGTTAGRNGNRPLFFIPPIHGRFDELRNICNGIKRPCIGLNWTKRLGQASSIAEVVEVYLDLLESVDWDRELNISNESSSLGRGKIIDLVGYSFGATIAFETMIQIQKRWLLQETHLQPGRLVLLDGSPKQIELGSEYLKSLTGRKPQNIGYKVDQLLMVYIIANMRKVTSSAKMPSDFSDQLRSLQVSLRKASIPQDKVKVASEWLAERIRTASASSSPASSSTTTPEPLINDRWSPDSGIENGRTTSSDGSDEDDGDYVIGNKPPDCSEIALAMEAFCRRYEIIDKYSADAILANNCTLIRAEEQFLKKGSSNQQSNGTGGNYNEDLGLSSVISGRVDLHVFKGDHESFLNVNAKEIINLIDQ